MAPPNTQIDPNEVEWDELPQPASLNQTSIDPQAVDWQQPGGGYGEPYRGAPRQNLRAATPAPPPPADSFGHVMSEVVPEIGRQVASGVGAAKEATGFYKGRMGLEEALRAQIVPLAVQEQKKNGGLYWDQPSVVAAAKQLGVRPDQFFPSDWERYLKMPSAERQDVTQKNLARAQEGVELEQAGRETRETAKQVGELYQPNLGGTFNPKNIAFQALTSLPQTLLGIGVGAMNPEAGLAVFAGTAYPQFLAQARDKGLPMGKSMGFAAMMAASEVATEVPLFEVIGQTPAGKAMLRRVAGKYADSFAGKVAGAGATEGVMEALNQALQVGIQDGSFNEHTSLADALQQIAQAGLIGAVSGATLEGGVHGIHTGVERATRPAEAKPAPVAKPAAASTKVSGTEVPVNETPTQPVAPAAPAAPENTTAAAATAPVEAPAPANTESAPVSTSTEVPTAAPAAVELPSGTENTAAPIPGDVSGGDQAPQETAQAPAQSPVAAGNGEAAAPAAVVPENAQKGTTAHEVAGQTVLVNTSPTPAQVKAGNYRMGQVKFQGLNVAIENPKGSERTFTRPDGKPGKRVMQDDYGYVKGTEGADGDGVDVFIGPDANAPNAYVIDQLTPDGKKYDEHKVVLGANSEQEASELYLRNYQKGWKGLGAITPITMDRFKTWVNRGVQKQPLAWVAPSERNVKARQPQHDSLLEFIAKTKLHGAKGFGLNTDAMESEGLDPADMKVLRGAGITRPFSKNGGKSLDAMAEVLAEHGYPVTDKQGNYDPHILLEKISQEMAGNPVFSIHKEHRDPELERKQQLESFMQTYEPPKKLFDVEDDELDHWIDMLDAIEKERKQGGEAGDRVMFSRDKQSDFFGDAEATKNELQRLIAEKDRRRNTGQESVETGKADDLFSQARKQTDITDAKPAKAPVKALPKAYEFGEQVREELGLSEFHLNERHGDIRVSMLLVPKGKRNEGLGTKAMERLVAYADERGMRIILQTGERDDVHGTTSSTRLKKFYKRFGFFENRGRNRDFTIRDNMVRDPVQMTSDKVRIREDGATYRIEMPKKQAQGGGQLDIFAAAANPEPAQKAAKLLTRTKAVAVGEFNTGITVVKSRQDAAHILSPLRKNAQENFFSLVLDKDQKAIAVLRTGIGTVDGASVEPWSLIGSILSIPGAHSVYFGHNHPSGNISQSQADEMITYRLADLLKNTGVRSEGMFVFAPGQKKATHFDRPNSDTQLAITPARRNKRLPLLERKLVKISPASYSRPTMSSPSAVKAYVKAMGDRTGMLVLDHRLSMVGFLDLTNGEMAKLRTDNTGTGAALVLRTLHEANAASVVLLGERKPIANLRSLLASASAKVIDGIYKDEGGNLRSEEEQQFSWPSSTHSYAHTARDPAVVKGPITLAEMGDNHAAMVESTASAWALLQMHKFSAQKGQSAHIAGNVYLPTDKVAKLKSNRPFDGELDEASIADIANAMQKNGYDFRFPVLVTVDGKGNATLFDGSHRARAAAAAGLRDIPAQVVYLDGGEHVEGQFAPENLGQAAMASTQPELEYSQVARQQTAAVRSAVASVMENFERKPPVNVVEDFASLPPEVFQRIGGYEAMRGGVNAFIDFTPSGSHIYMVANRVKSPQHVAELLAHEMTHYGIESVLEPDEWSAIAHGVLRDQKARVQDILKRETRTLDMNNPRHQALVVHEVLAYMNQKRQVGKPFDQVEEGLWNRLMRALRAGLARLGLTGPAYNDKYIGELLDSMTAKMRSQRIQAAHGDIPGYVNLAPLKNQDAPVFYSAVATAVTDIKTAKASGEQWWNTLRNRPGVKPDELDWLGLEDWLKSQPGPVTKQAVQDYIAANQIQVHDVLHGGGSSNELLQRRDDLAVRMTALGYTPHFGPDDELDQIQRNRDGKFYYFEPVKGLVDDDSSPADVPNDVSELARQLHVATTALIDSIEDGDEEDGTRYSQYTLPGGENYRELLLTLPERDRITTEKVDSPRGWGDTEGGNVGIVRHGDTGADYRSSHWNEPNVLAHIRTKDRTDKDGKKVLFVEEIQSDWHQAGRKRGYKEPVDTTGWTAVFAGDQWGVFNNEQKLIGRVLRGRPMSGRATTEQEAIAEVARRQTADQVPDAPFKTTWPELAFKRVLRMAAEGGYDRIAWTTGDQQNKRYSLEKIVGRVELSDNDSGGRGKPNMDGPFERGFMRVFDHGGNEIYKSYINDPSEVEDFIGADLAKELLALPGEEEERAGIGIRMRRIGNLVSKIGGEGMRGFYDQILPATVNRLVKKWGGKVGELRLAKTEGIDMPGKSNVKHALTEYADGNIDLEELSERVGVNVERKDVEFIEGSDPYRKEELRREISNLADVLIQRGKGQPGTKQHALEITDAMRQAAIAGLPLFHRETMQELQTGILDGSVSLEEDSWKSRQWNWLVFRAQDKFNDVLRLQTEAAKYREDMAIPEKLDAYMRETLYHGRTEYRFEQYDKDFVQPLMKMVKKSGYTFDQVEQYLYARHAPEANAHIKKITAGHPDLFGEDDEWHSGMTDEQAAANMATLRAGGDFKNLEAIGNHVDAMTQLRRNLLVTEGLENPAVVGAWEAAYQHYVPLRGWADKPQRARHPPRGRGFDTGVRGDKRRTGRKTLAGNIMATIVGQAQATMILAEKAKVGRAFLAFAKTHPSSMYTVNNVEMERYFDEASGLVRERPVFRGMRADNLLRVKVDGHDEWIEFDQDDPQAMRIATAFKNLSSKEINGLLSFLLGVNRFLATVNTSLNPDFIASNALKDLQTAMINMNASSAKGLQGKVLRDWRKAFAGIMSGEFGKGEHEWAQYFTEFKRAGAKTGWIDFTASPVDLEAKLRAGLDDKGVWNVSKKGLKTVLGVIDRVNLGVENAIRLSVFVNAREAGTSEDKAAELSKNLTINFNRKGDWGTELNALYLFYNAAAQGTAVLWNVMKNKTARRVLYGLAAIGIAQQIINRLVAGDDDDGENRYDKIPAYERAKNIIIMLPRSMWWTLPSGDEMDHLKIPLPYGYNMIHYTGAMIGDIIDYNFIGNKHRLDVGGMAASWISEFLGAFNPIGSSASLVQTMAPTVMDPAVALYENQNWYGGHIYPTPSEFDVKPPGSETYYKNASDLSKLMAHELNTMTGGSDVTPGGISIPPNALDYVAEQAYGGLGKFVENTGRTAINLATDREKLDVTELPFVRRLVGQTGDRYITDTYRERQQKVRYLDKEMDKLKTLPKDSEAYKEKQAYIAANYPIEQAVKQWADRTDKRIKFLRERRNALEAGKGQMLETTRQDRLKDIDIEVKGLMQDFNSDWNTAEDAARAPKNTRDVTGSILPMMEGKTKPDAVRALKGAGYPALAALVDAMPFRPRPPMAEAYRKEIAS